LQVLAQQVAADNLESRNRPDVWPAATSILALRHQKELGLLPQVADPLRGLIARHGCGRSSWYTFIG
jgi:hypothetical protein